MILLFSKDKKQEARLEDGRVIMHEIYFGKSCRGEISPTKDILISEKLIDILMDCHPQLSSPKRSSVLFTLFSPSIDYLSPLVVSYEKLGIFIYLC